MKKNYVLRLTLCGLLVLFLSFSGCAGLLEKKPPADRGKPPAVAATPLDEARQAYLGGDYARAAAVALRLASDQSLPREQGVEANRILAAAALQNNHPSNALTALDQWRILAPGADSAREWQDAWARAMRALSSSFDARTRAHALYQDTSRSVQVRSVAGVFLAVREWRDGSLGQSMAALENLYSSAASAQNKAVLERRLALELTLAPAATSALAVSAVTESNQGSFPYALIFIDVLRRESAKPESRETAQAALKQLAAHSSLADASLFRGPPAESAIVIQGSAAVPAPAAPVPGRPVVLALPLSRQHAAVAGKIADGARVARDELAASGNPFSLLVIDTDQPDWVAQIDALPRNAVVVGGPLRRDDYARAKAQGLTSRRVLFTFLPALEAGDEGRTAWRFFSGAQDQADTLLAFTSRLGIRGYAVFYPEEHFGRRMAALFEERARAAGAGNVMMQSYKPGDTNDWMQAASDLLGARSGGRAFQAIFLPDSWRNMDQIVPNFFYFNETRLVLLGTSLWEQGLSSGNFVSMQYYNLAVFPGSWNAAQPSAAGQRLQAGLANAGADTADYWAGIGYDFARMAAGLGVAEGWTPDSVNAALQAADIDWSIAPIRWNGGVATQQMYLFQPRADGFAPVNEAEFRAAFEAAWR